MPQVEQRPDAVNRGPEQLRQLADQHRERNAVHVAVADGLRQQLGDETEARQSRGHAHQARHQRHHAGQRDRPHRVACRKWQQNSEDHGCQRRIRPQHQDATGAEQRVGEQRHDGGVQSVDSRHARCHGISDSDRHQHRGQHQSRHQVTRQPCALVAREHLQARQPAPPAGDIGPDRAPEATGFRLR